ncbi:MAG: hypothetical protein IPO81_14735 [Kouleothrix sp.]|nr:hypothetical protein [Kouleothrix sp.]
MTTTPSHRYGLYESLLIALRKQDPTLSATTTIELARTIQQKILHSSDLAAAPEERILEQLQPTIQLMLADNYSSIEHAAQYAVQILYVQLSDDLKSAIPERYRGADACPYPGLAAFSEGTALFFHGRADDVRTAVAGLDRTMLAITGPSGVGKSSFINAGLLPEIRRQWGEKAKYLSFRLNTGIEPLSDLAHYLSEQEAGPPKQLSAALSQRDDGLLESLQKLRPVGDGRVLFIVDQFEELFVGEGQSRASERQHFLDNLLWIDVQSPRWLTIIIATRENFYEHPDYIGRPRLSQIVQDENIPLRALSNQQLRQAIENPLAVFNQQYRQHVQFQAGLIDLIIQSFVHPAVSLPLLQYMLRLLWIEKNQLTHQAYNSLGGLERVLDRHATQIFADFAGHDQRLVKAILVALVRPGLSGEYTRKRVRRDMVLGDVGQREDRGRVLNRLSDPRSRIVSEQHIGDIVYVELTHEILLRQWTLLQGLIEARKERIEERERLLPTAELWLLSTSAPGARGDSSYLYQGSTLKRAQRHIEETPSPEDTDQTIIACYQASRLHQRRSRIRLAVTLSTTLVLLALLFVYALNWFTADTQRRLGEEQVQRATADSQRLAEQQRADMNATAQVVAQAQANANATAQALAQSQADANARAQSTAEAQTAREQQEKDRQARLALSRRLANTARTMFDQQLDRALLLSVEAYHVQDTFEARSTLLAALQYSPHLRTFLRSGQRRVESIVYSPDGRLLAAAGDGKIVLWDVGARRQIGTVASDGADQQNALAFSPDGKLLASVSAEGPTMWDVAALQPAGSPLRGNRFPVNCITFSPDGRLLVSGGGNADAFSDAGEMIFWDATTHEMLGEPLTTQLSVTSLAFSPDGTILAAGIKDGSGQQPLMLLDAATRQVIAQPTLEGSSAEIVSLAFSPDGKTLASGSMRSGPASEGGEILLWDVSARQARGAPKTSKTMAVKGLAFSTDGSTLISTGGLGDQDVLLWPVEAADLSRALHGHTNQVTSVAVSADGRTFASSDASGNILLWDLWSELTLGRTLQLRESLYGPADVDAEDVRALAFSDDDRTLIGVNRDGAIDAWDIATGARVGGVSAFPSSEDQAAERLSPDGKTKVIPDEQITLVDVDTGQTLGIFNARASSALINHDGKHMVSYGSPAHAYLPHPPILWDLDAASWQAQACGIANRNLTQTEWKQFVPGEPYRATCTDLPAGT